MENCDGKYSFSNLQAVLLGLEVERHGVEVLRRGLLADDVCEERHLAVLLRQLEGLVDALAHHEELDGRVEVAQTQEELGHQLGALGAPRLL